MREVLILGGYGHAGKLVARELVETTPARVALAGRSIQKAERAAVPLGERVRGVYADATDPRTLRAVLSAAAVVVDCTPGQAFTALELATETPVPFVGIASVPLPARAHAALGERAWRSRVAVIPAGGAVPGLPGILAEHCVRRLPEIHALRIASTGTWNGTEAARRDALQLAARTPVEYRERRWQRARSGSTRWRFPEPIGLQTLRPVAPIELHAFAEAHCIHNLCYLEATAGPLLRALERVIGPTQPGGFAVAAEAWIEEEAGPPAARVCVQADDAPSAAAAVVGALVRAILAGKAPAGLGYAHEALDPLAFLASFEKRGLRVSTDASA